MKLHGNKIQLVLDESDEISNPYAVRTKAALDCFRRCRAKLLTTGTSTRNNIVEFAPQQELLYNNSINMICWCKRVYHYDSEAGGSMRRETTPTMESRSLPIRRDMRCSPPAICRTSPLCLG